MTTQDRISIAVIGNGLMGAGITQVFAMAGHDVMMIGRCDTRLAEARARIEADMREFVSHGLLENAEAALERISTSTRLGHAGSAGLVIEAVTEDLPLKRAIFADLDAICPADVILSSSSGQPASALVDWVRRPERVIAAHFWYPAPMIPVVEVCAGPQTDPGVTLRVIEILRAAGKEPVEILKELPGMIGNRLQFALLREAWSLWASGVASAEAIDMVMKKTIGRRLGVTGPIESADLGGLDTLYSFAASLQPHLDAHPDPSAEVGALVQAGARGLSNGRGVYDWRARDGAALKAERMQELFRWLALDRTPDCSAERGADPRL